MTKYELLKKIAEDFRELEAMGHRIKFEMTDNGTLIFFNGGCMEYMNGQPIIEEETTS